MDKAALPKIHPFSAAAAPSGTFQPPFPRWTPARAQICSVARILTSRRRTNRTLKDAIVKRYHETHNQLREYLSAFVAAYKFAKQAASRGPR